MWEEHSGAFEAESIIALTLRAGSIQEVSAFRTLELFAFFGLPERLLA
jgi:hypothetical protein